MVEHAQQLLKIKKPAEVAEELNEKGYRNFSGDLWNSESVSWFRVFFLQLVVVNKKVSKLKINFFPKLIRLLGYRII